MVALTDWKDRPGHYHGPGVNVDHLSNMDGLIVAIVRIEPGAVVPPHSHEHSDEVFDGLEGEGEVLVDGTWHPIRPGVTVVIPAGAVHGFRNESGAPLALRETIRQRVYARQAIKAAIRKRLPRYS